MASRCVWHLPVLPVQGLNVYDVLNHEHLALTVDAVAGDIRRYVRCGGKRTDGSDVLSGRLIAAAGVGAG